MEGMPGGIPSVRPEGAMRFRYVCNDCGAVYETNEIMYLCPKCAEKNDGREFARGNLIVELSEDVLRQAAGKEHVSPEDFYPYVTKMQDCFPIGTTPLLRPRRLNGKYGMENTFFKLDSQLISGSFKDRASYLVAEQAIAHGERKIALASTGNAGAAMSAVGAAMGLDIILFVPKTAPINKLMQSVLYGAHVVPVDGTYDDAFKLSIEYTRLFGGINRNTAYNPMTIEGKKSISIELFEQLGRRAPDAIYVPVGDGCIIAGVAKGFIDLRRAGLIDRLPHIVCCQSSRSDAITRAFESGRYLPVEATTRADSISVSLPANGRMAVRYIKESDGWCVMVEDEEILESQTELTGQAGVLVEPAAACAYACYRKDIGNLERKLGKDALAVVLLTGTGFKDMKVFEGRVGLPEPIENSLEAVKALRF